MPTPVSSDELDILFLLELLVDKVKIDRQPNVDLGVKMKETCVVFKLMDFPPLIVTEEDFVYLENYEDTEVNFKSGKSILFSLPSFGPGYCPGDSVQVNVGRRADPPPSPEQHTVPIGQAEIPLGGSFVNLMKECNYQNSMPTTSKTIKGTYGLKDESNSKAGEITVFLRLSCFGKLIVTEFEVKGPETSNFWFRGGPDAADLKERDDKAGSDEATYRQASDKPSNKLSFGSNMTTGPYAVGGPSGPCGGTGGGGKSSMEGRFTGPCFGSQSRQPQSPPMGQDVGQFPPGAMMPQQFQYGYQQQMYCPPMMGQMQYNPQMGQPPMMPSAPTAGPCPPCPPCPPMMPSAPTAMPYPPCPPPPRPQPPAQQPCMPYNQPPMCGPPMMPMPNPPTARPCPPPPAPPPPPTPQQPCMPYNQPICPPTPQQPRTPYSQTICPPTPQQPYMPYNQPMCPPSMMTSRQNPCPPQPCAEGCGGWPPSGGMGPYEGGAGRCLTTRQTQVEDGDFKAQSGDKKSNKKKDSKRDSEGSNLSDTSKSALKGGGKKKKGKK